MCKIRPFGSSGWWNRYIRPSCICKRLWFVFDKMGDFMKFSRTNYVPQKGDIRVWQNYPGGSVAGHIHLFNGQSWVSDFSNLITMVPIPNTENTIIIKYIEDEKNQFILRSCYRYLYAVFLRIFCTNSIRRCYV